MESVKPLLTHNKIESGKDHEKVFKIETQLEDINILLDLSCEVGLQTLAPPVAFMVNSNNFWKMEECSNKIKGNHWRKLTKIVVHHAGPFPVIWPIA